MAKGRTDGEPDMEPTGKKRGGMIHKHMPNGDRLGHKPLPINTKHGHLPMHRSMKKPRGA